MLPPALKDVQEEGVGVSAAGSCGYGQWVTGGSVGRARNTEAARLSTPLTSHLVNLLDY